LCINLHDDAASRESSFFLPSKIPFVFGQSRSHIVNARMRNSQILIPNPFSVSFDRVVEYKAAKLIGSLVRKTPVQRLIDMIRASKELRLLGSI